MSKKFTSNIKLNLLIIGVSCLMVLSCVAGFHLGKNKNEPLVSPTETTAPVLPADALTEGPVQRLRLSATIDHEAGSTEIPVQDRAQTVLLCNLSNVTIGLDDGLFLLDEALASGFVSPEELIAWAKQDAAQGICREIYESENGLAHFIYRYSQLELCVYDDVYETPDGQTHLIRDLTIRESGGTGTGAMLSRADEKGIRQSIAREDWGLSFSIERAGESSLNLICTQSGGQQIGQLEIVECVIYATESASLVFESEDTMVIQSDAESSFHLDCAAFTSALSSGNYSMRLIIRDNYNPDQAHPLMRNFEDSQSHFIDFSLP